MNYTEWTQHISRLNALHDKLTSIAKKLEFAIEKCRLSDGKINLPNISVLENDLETINRECEDVLNSNLCDQTNRMAYHEYVEFASLEEYNKFRDLPPITLDEIHCTDLDGMYEHFGNIS